MLACTATDAGSFVDSRDNGGIGIVLVHKYHLDGTRRTVAFTIATFHAVGEDDTVFLDPDGMSDLYARLVFATDGLDGTCGTHFRAAGTFGTAVTTLVTHGRLHQSEQT